MQQTMPDIAGAARFLASSARVLDRRRYERLFAGGPAEPVRDAVAAYRNPDGGFGHALEPDVRTATSQPAAVEAALRFLHEADAWDDAIAADALAWLERHEAEGGGIPFITDGLEDAPHAPWWAPDPGRPASLTLTGALGATLHARGVEHPWLARADAALWRRLDAIAGADPHPYDLRGALAFLERTPERGRAEAAFPAVAALVAERVALDPEAEGEVHGPLDYAPRPGSPARRLFDDATVEAHLHHLAGAQLEDGGWTFDWLAWSPAAATEWRGQRTVDALVTLRAYGRL